VDLPFANELIVINTTHPLPRCGTDLMFQLPGIPNALANGSHYFLMPPREFSDIFPALSIAAAGYRSGLFASSLTDCARWRL